MPVETPTRIVGRGETARYLDASELHDIVREGIETGGFAGKRVLCLVPDGTRTMPMPLMYSLFQELLRPHVPALDFLVALGTHAPMSDEHLSQMIGQPVIDGACGQSRIYNHRWDLRESFTRLGVIPAADIGKITGGKLAQDVPVELNRLILDYDHI